MSSFNSINNHDTKRKGKWDKDEIKL